MGKKPKDLYFYCDYHNVLDAEGRKGMKTFLRGLDCMLWSDMHDGTMWRTLLSHGGPSRHEKTLEELCDAGVVHLLDKIVFTKLRTGGHHFNYVKEMTYTMKQGYFAERRERHEESGNWTLRRGHMETIRYQVFDGGKDAYIHKRHQNEENHAILFVDDRADNLRAVCDIPPWMMTPLPNAIEMRWKPPFSTEESKTYAHAENLHEVLKLIMQWRFNLTEARETDHCDKRRRVIEAPAEKENKKARNAGMTPLPDGQNNTVRHRHDAMRTIYTMRLQLATNELPEIKQVQQAFIREMTNVDSEKEKEDLREAFRYFLKARNSLE